MHSTCRLVAGDPFCLRKGRYADTNAAMFTSARSRFSTFLRLLVAITMLSLAAACDKELYDLDLDWSVNVFKPSAKWPNLKKMKPEERAVYDKYGRPDFFRVQWDKAGSIKLREELEKELQGKKPKTLPPFSWVYLKENREVVFDNQRPVERPLTEPVKIVIANGDPEDVKEVYGGVKQWMFFSTGKIYKIAGNQVIESKDFPAMGKYLK